MSLLRLFFGLFSTKQKKKKTNKKKQPQQTENSTLLPLQKSNQTKYNGDDHSNNKKQVNSDASCSWIMTQQLNKQATCSRMMCICWGCFWKLRSSRHDCCTTVLASGRPPWSNTMATHIPICKCHFFFQKTHRWVFIDSCLITAKGKLSWLCKE